MNLYAIIPAYAAHNEVTFVLAETDDEAMSHGVYVAAKDVADECYFSPTASVYRVAENLPKVGDARAADAPKDWGWAHPAVEKGLATEEKLDALARTPGDAETEDRS